MATVALYNISLTLSIIAFLLMFVSFASPYWYKSWTRVHSPFSNIGLWHVCFAGYIMPGDAVLKSYVGCWWIHSYEFDRVKDTLQPVWFRFIQLFAVIVLLCNLVAMVLIIFNMIQDMHEKLYKGKMAFMFMVNSIILFIAAFLVLLLALVFAMKVNDGSWMPRPWMNYLSWSYGFCVLSGFLDAFAGICLFISALIYKDKEQRAEQSGIDTVPSPTEKNSEWLDTRQPAQPLGASQQPSQSYTASRQQPQGYASRPPAETSYQYKAQGVMYAPDPNQARRRKEKEAGFSSSQASLPSLAPSHTSHVSESQV